MLTLTGPSGRTKSHWPSMSLIHVELLQLQLSLAAAEVELVRYGPT